MQTRFLRPMFVLALALALGTPAAWADSKLLHLSIGDPARKDRDAPVVLDGITDTKTGEQITPTQLAARLADTKLLLVGEEHTNAGFHAVQFAVIRALAAAGRKVMIGLEMYPYTEQRWLTAWSNGQLTEDGFVRLSHWYDNWGYNWQYYRDIFLFARDHDIQMFGVNAPRDVVSAVGRKGLAGLSPEEAAHLPKDIDPSDADHTTFFKTTFEDESGGAMHVSTMPEAMLKNIIAAQTTWDASMGFYAVKALKQEPDPKAIMVVLVGSGHVAYGVGIERQSRKWLDGTITTIVPVTVGLAKANATTNTRASYANFTWGVPGEIDSAYPAVGISTMGGKPGQPMRIIDVQKDSPAAQGGLKVGDVLVSLDGTPLVDKETYNLLVGGKRWGDASVFVVKRNNADTTVNVVFRRALPEEPKAPEPPKPEPKAKGKKK